MKDSRGKSNGISPLAIIVWVALAVICIQGYFLLRQNEPQPGAKKPDQSVTPVKTPLGEKENQGKTKVHNVKPSGDIKGRIAIVIDDWGYNKTHCSYLAGMPEPAGIAILPGLPYSRDVIKCAAANGKDPMLHLPLEPFNHKEMYQDGYVLTTFMNASELKLTAARIMDEMKGVAGVNNHTGSKASESELVMTAVLAEVKRRGLFFVDSRTSDKSVAGLVAGKLGMHIARRDVFLDNRNDRISIERQFALTAKIARESGFALAIAHDRVLSLQIITEQMKKLSKEGYDFLSVPEYIKDNEYPRH